MVAGTICSDFGARENKVCHCFHCFPIYLPWSDGTRCHDLSFLNAESHVSITWVKNKKLSLNNRIFQAKLHGNTSSVHGPQTPCLLRHQSTQVFLRGADHGQWRQSTWSALWYLHQHTLANLQKSSIGVTSLEFFTCLSLGIQSIPQPDSTDGPPSYFPPRSKSKISLLLSFLTQERLVFSEPAKNLNRTRFLQASHTFPPAFELEFKAECFCFVWNASFTCMSAHI